MPPGFATVTEYEEAVQEIGIIDPDYERWLRSETCKFDDDFGPFAW